MEKYKYRYVQIFHGISFVQNQRMTEYINSVAIITNGVTRQEITISLRPYEVAKAYPQFRRI